MVSSSHQRKDVSFIQLTHTIYEAYVGLIIRKNSRRKRNIRIIGG